MHAETSSAQSQAIMICIQATPFLTGTDSGAIRHNIRGNFDLIMVDITWQVVSRLCLAGSACNRLMFAVGRVLSRVLMEPNATRTLGFIFASLLALSTSAARHHQLTSLTPGYRGQVWGRLPLKVQGPAQRLKCSFCSDMSSS